jgi:hypothetical protein
MACEYVSHSDDRQQKTKNFCFLVVLHQNSVRQSERHRHGCSGGKLQSQLGIREVDTISSRECVMCQHLPAFTPSCGWQPFIFSASDVREGSGAKRHSLADDANKQSPDSLGSASGAALLTDKVWQQGPLCARSS